MTVYVDTSALYPLMDGSDADHLRASTAFDALADERLVTTNYVILESAVLVRSRLGPAAVQDFFGSMVPIFLVEWVDQQLQEEGVASYLAHGGGTSLVDRVSFALMRSRGIERAFAFDRDFRQEGFLTVP